MKTLSYNPSDLERDFATALQNLKGPIEKHLINNRITHIENHSGKENPMVRFSLVDNDGDAHEIVIRIIQIPDKF